LELILGSHTAIAAPDDADLMCQWRLFANAEACAVQAVRGLLIKPFAVADVPFQGKQLLAGAWQLRIPNEQQVRLRVTGSKPGPSWESKLGLGFDDKAIAFRKETGLSATAWDELKIELVDRECKRDLDVEGVYDRSSDCGAPNGSLHIRRGGREPLYLFREVDPVKHASADRFVFAPSHEKLPLGEAREHHALLAEGWRPSTDKGRLEEDIMATIPGKFLALPPHQILLSMPPQSVSYACPENLDLVAPPTDAQLVTKVALPMAPASNGLWSAQWRDAAQRGREGPARSLHWLRGAVSDATQKHNNWQPLPSAEAGNCLAKGFAGHDIVAPKLPSVKWVTNPKTGTLVAQERTEEASTFERARRACPRPLAALCQGQGGSGELLVAARPQICALQAATLLSKEVLPGTNKEGLELAYRIFPTTAPDPEVPDAVWVTVPEDQESLPLHGRYLLKSSGRNVTYLREACGKVRLKLFDNQWQATVISTGRILMVSDGDQGAGVLPHQVQAWRLCNLKGFEQEVNHKILVKASEQKTFGIAGNEHDKMDPRVPAGWNPEFPLWPMQCRSVSWLRTMEESTAPYLQEAMENFEIQSLGLRIEGRATMPTHGNRAVLADGVGFGKTAVVLARLLDKTGDTAPIGELTEEGKMTSKATIVFVPPHLVGQWMEEKDKFITDDADLVTIQINGVRDLEDLTVKEICEADLIVCNFDLLQSSKYLERLSDLATGGARSVNRQKGRYQPAIYEEVVDSLRKVARSMMKPKSQAAKLDALETSREKNFEDLRAAECESNMTRKLMNEQRKKRRKGIQMSLKESSDNSFEYLWDDDERPEQVLDLVNMPFEFFDFRRLVCDEVSFASGMACTALSYGVRGRSQLCLTGTPGLDSTKAVGQLARTVGMIIGPDEPPPEELGKRNEKESTAAESLYHFLRAPDEGRYRRQNECAKEWLARFCRHNEPAKAGIPVQHDVVRVRLTAVERVLYTERDRDLRGLDVTAILRKARGARGGQRRDERLRAALKDCQDLQTQNEVLMHTASYTSEGEGKISAVISRVRKQRQDHLEETLDELTEKARDLQHRHLELQRLEKGKEDDFARLVQRIDTGAQSVDHDLDTRLRRILAFAKANPRRKDKLWAKPGKDDEKEEKDGGDEAKRKDELEMKIKEGVNSAHGLGALLKEITNRHRTLRFFESVADCVQKSDQCAKCDASGESAPRRDFIVLPCGHRGCKKAFFGKVQGQGRCAVEGCAQQNVVAQDLLHISSLIKEDKETVIAHGPCGSKFAAIVDKLRNVLAEDATNRVLLFCQMDSLREKLDGALNKAKIPFATLDGTPQGMHLAMQQFKNATGKQSRVLLLALDERCAGANLTAANHVFFAHPVLKNGSRSPSDIETQAIGRARRFGQVRTVKVCRFLSQQTIEEKLEELNQLERHE
jgi:SNF2 family DNA or RNA helicase